MADLKWRISVMRALRHSQKQRFRVSPMIRWILTVGVHSQYPCYLLTTTFEASSSNNLPSDEWIGAVSGLNIGAPSPSDGQIQMLVEYLTGEEGGTSEQVSAAQISRLFIVGDSMAPMLVTGKGEADAEGGSKKPVCSR